MKLPYKYAFSGLLPILSAPAFFQLIAMAVIFSGLKLQYPLNQPLSRHIQ
jgi:hypothetical protein